MKLNGKHESKLSFHWFYGLVGFKKIKNGENRDYVKKNYLN